MRKAILVIGAAGGVGLQLTKQLIERRYEVIGTVLDPAQEDDLRLQAPGVRAIVRVDLTDANSIANHLTTYLNASDIELAGAVVCAAVAPHGPLEFAPLKDLRMTFEVNVVSCIAIYQLCLPYLRQTQGRLIFVSSHGGRAGFPFIGQYSGSKFALEGLGDVMRREAAPFNVRVILIQPGSLQTGMTVGQLAKIKADIALLSAQESDLYGDLYRGFQSIIQSAIAGGTMPEVVASEIVCALESKAPKTRYPVGQDAVDLIAMSRTAADEEIDAAFAGMFAQGVVDASMPFPSC